MRRITTLLILTILNFGYAQHKHPLIENVTIELKSYGLSTVNYQCSKNSDEPDEKRYRVYFVAKFKDFSERKTIDFNNISLVDVDNKVRYRAIGASFPIKDWSTSSFDITEYEYEDTFLKYSQEGIEDFDHYKYEVSVVSTKKKHKPKIRLRIKPEHFKKKRGLNFRVSFPAAKTKKPSGKYKIYWKDKIIGQFKLKNGSPI